jgi:hypothetical protein
MIPAFLLAAVLTPTPTPLPAPPCGGTICQPLVGRPCNEGAHFESAIAALVRSRVSGIGHEKQSVQMHEALVFALLYVGDHGRPT